MLGNSLRSVGIVEIVAVRMARSWPFPYQSKTSRLRIKCSYSPYPDNWRCRAINGDEASEYVRVLSELPP